MKKFLTFVFIGLITLNLSAQVESNINNIDSTEVQQNLINDGPYVFIEDNKLTEVNIVDGKVESKELKKDAFPIKFKSKSSKYEGINKIVALSDLHGQFQLATEILKNNKVIDENLNWNFGNGHLVIVGDIFDRGDKVTEILWLVYKLEKQAENAGGKVHYLLGNHEYMVLNGDDRYLNPKYVKAAQLLNTEHKELYGENTVLGRWLRSKPTVLRLNDNVFVHGGISKNLLQYKFRIDKINKAMVREIDKPRDTISNPEIDIYFSGDGPIWYRGYFYDSLSDQEIQEILNAIDTKHIVVGHCSNEEVVQLYDKKIFGVDSSIKNGEYGEVLFINVNDFERGKMNGEREKF